MRNLFYVIFEELCAKVLEADSFVNVRVTKPSGDFGGDILATKDQINYVIQCKRHQSNIGIQAIQEVIGSRSVYGCHVGVVMTNRYFTKAAQELANNNNILLWDRNRLKKMMARLNK